MPFLINHYRNRTRDYDIQLFESDGTTEVLLAAQDVVIVHVYRVGETPVLEIRSDEIEPGGSKITFTAATNNICLRIASGDVGISDIETGVYELDVIIVDASDTLDGADVSGEAAAKHAESGTLAILPSGVGTIDEDESSSS